MNNTIYDETKILVNLEKKEKETKKKITYGTGTGRGNGNGIRIFFCALAINAIIANFFNFFIIFFFLPASTLSGVKIVATIMIKTMAKMAI